MIENLANFTAEEIKNSFPDATIKEGTGMFEEGTVEKILRCYTPKLPMNFILPGLIIVKLRSMRSDFLIRESGNLNLV